MTCVDSDNWLSKMTSLPEVQISGLYRCSFGTSRETEVQNQIPRPPENA